jgi:hypothetical protein
MDSVQGRVFDVARRVATELVAYGAEAVILTGSYVRGDASLISDIDLYAIGDGPEYRLEQRSGHLVSISWRSARDVRASFINPALAGAAVPGWRRAVILSDSGGIAERLVREASGWDWDAIGDDITNTWVTEELTGLAEEVHKLIGLLEHGRLQAAAIQRSVLALRVPVVMAVHLRLLYDSENMLWDLVAEQMGIEWSTAQLTALGVSEHSFEEGCSTSLLLFTQACDSVEPRFNHRQRSVVQAARRTISAYGNRMRK